MKNPGEKAPVIPVQTKTFSWKALVYQREGHEAMTKQPVVYNFSGRQFLDSGPNRGVYGP